MPGNGLLATPSMATCSVVLLAALYTDITWGKIPNVLTLPSAAAGVCFHFLDTGSVQGIFYALKGLSIGCFPLLIPFCLRGIGGGDVKLMAALGAWLGPAAVLHVFLYGAVLGAAMALWIMAIQRRMPSFGGIRQDIVTLVLTRQPPGGGVRSASPTLPYSIPLSAGFLGFLALGRVF
jgi:prepilin peptidase CpaA